MYYSNAFRVAADRDGVFETELVRVAKDAPRGEWADYRFDPLVVRAVRFPSLAGVSEGKRAHPVLHEFEIVGEPGKPAAWQFNNYGYTANDAKAVQDSHGRPMVLIASATGYVYALGLDGKPLWQADLGSAVLCLAADGQGLYAGYHDGGVRCLSREGEVRGNLPGSAPVKLLRILPGAKPALIAADRDEDLRVLAHPTS